MYQKIGVLENLFFEKKILKERERAKKCINYIIWYTCWKNNEKTIHTYIYFILNTLIV